MAIRDIYLLKRSNQFHLGARQEISVDLSLKKAHRAPCTVLSGYVFGKCGRIHGATVKVFDRSYKPIAHTVSDHNGEFIFENILPPGDYRIVATAEGYKVSHDYRVILKSRKPVSIFIRLKVSKNINLGTVYGVVYDVFGGTLADAEIQITDYDDPDAYEAFTKTNGDGEFLVNGLKPKKYWITASKEGYLLPQKISFELSPNEITCINLFLYPDESSTDGTVSGRIDHFGNGIPNAVTALYKVEGHSHTLLSTKETNENGVYLFQSVKPGEYLVKSKKDTDHITHFT